MRAFTIKTKTLNSAESVFDALRRFDPILESESYSVSVDVGESDRRILEVLDAIYEHVEKGQSLTRVELDGRHFTITRRTRSCLDRSQFIARRRCIVTVVPSANGSTTTESINSSMIARPSPRSSLTADSSCHRP